MRPLKVYCSYQPWKSWLAQDSSVQLTEDLDQAELVIAESRERLKAQERGLLFVCVDPHSNRSELKQTRSRHRDFSILMANGDLKKTRHRMKILFAEALRRVENQKERDLLIKHNQDLRRRWEVNRKKIQNLEEGQAQRSSVLRKAAQNLRKRVFFLKQLSEAVELEEVIIKIKDEVRKIKGLGDPILILRNSERVRLIYTSGRQVVEKSIAPLQESSLASMRQALADHLNRPIGPIISLEGSRLPLWLVFENQLEPFTAYEVREEWKLRLVGIELVLERFQLAQGLSEAALFWEKTFDGLGEPIGIFSSQNEVIRVNRLFTKNLMENLTESTIRQDSQIYHVEKYPIEMEGDVVDGAHVLHLSDQSSFFQLKQHMIQTEKIAALGLLAGHIAHELNNPLTGLRALCQVLQKDESLSDEVHEDISQVEQAASRCQNIIRNLLEYSKPHVEDHRTLTDISEVVSNTLPLLKSLMGKHRSDITLSSSSLTSLVDAHMLQQVVFNLVANACQAMEENGKVSVETSEDGGWVRIRVQDTGPGVPDSLCDEIFEPFFTTKPVGEGTGLGLSLSLNIIRGFGGEIRLDKSYKGGAAFEILLPKA